MAYEHGSRRHARSGFGDFLDQSDASGFSRMIRHLILSEHPDLYHLERYRHRLSMDGTPLHYFAIVARKISDTIPTDFADV